MKRIVFGGDKRDRTADLLHAMQALSQLSYTPIYYTALHLLFNPSARRNIKDGNLSCQSFLALCSVINRI
jgi:hypothetical protein